MYYFAYGTNINQEQIEREFRAVRVIGTARLDGWRLAFTRYAPRRGGGVLDALPDPTSHIWGVVYEVDEAEIEALDRARPDYRRVVATVLRDGDPAQPLDAWRYEVLNKATREFPPTPAYKADMLRGASARGFPADYIARLAAIETTESAG